VSLNRRGGGGAVAVSIITTSSFVFRLVLFSLVSFIYPLSLFYCHRLYYHYYIIYYTHLILGRRRRLCARQTRNKRLYNARARCNDSVIYVYLYINILKSLSVNRVCSIFRPFVLLPTTMLYSVYTR